MITMCLIFPLEPACSGRNVVGTSLEPGVSCDCEQPAMATAIASKHAGTRVYFGNLGYSVSTGV